MDQQKYKVKKVLLAFEKDIHSVNDGAQFPWMSDEKVEFCRANCTGPTYVYLNEMRQTYYVSRYWRYRIAVLHGEEHS